jgi:hypothetical protein
VPAVIAAPAPDPATLGRRLHLIYDGASPSARMDRDPTVAADARAASETLLDAALAGPTGPRVGSVLS